MENVPTYLICIVTSEIQYIFLIIICHCTSFLAVLTLHILTTFSSKSAPTSYNL